MILIKNGRIFNGTKKRSFTGSVLVENGRVKQIFKEKEALPVLPNDAEIIDASGCWITPGFIDSHTHYDFELLVNPALGESVRHGITTVMAGSCSITAIMSEPEDCSDIFTRVEGVPREQVLPILSEHKKWSRPKEYVNFLNKHPLGPNVCSYIGHSDMRIAAMGLEKAVTEGSVATAEEKVFMQDALQEAVDAGFLGMSSMQSDADRLDGDRERSKALPSVYANFEEYSYLNKILRKKGRILQTAPDVRNVKASMTHMVKELVSLYRKQLRITALVSMDSKSGRKKSLLKVQNLFGFLIKFLRGNFRWQMLPCEFHVRIQGMDFVIFEEVPAGAAFLHLTENADKQRLVRDPEFKVQFKKNLTERFRPALWNRDIGDGVIFSCPDKSLEGLSYAEVAKQKDAHVADVFVDLLVEYGEELIWKVVMGNERDSALGPMLEDRVGANLVSFSDAGAHIHNMAFYNFPLQMLARLKKMKQDGVTKMTDEHAIHRLTGELADWHRIDAGYLKVGARADINVLNPDHLESSLDSIEKVPFVGVEGLSRLVNRNEGIIRHVLVNGKLAVSNDVLHDDLGEAQGYGRFLAAM